MGASRQVPADLRGPGRRSRSPQTVRGRGQLLDRILSEKLLRAAGVYGFWPAASIADDILVYGDEARRTELARCHTLRQQWQRKGQEHFLALADFIAPLESGRHDYLGAFALTAGIGAGKIGRPL